MNQSKSNELKSERWLVSVIAIAILAILVISGPTRAQEGTQMDSKPTIVLVHGAFADSSSWGKIIPTLLKQGYPVVAASNPLRGVKNDADSVYNVLKSIKGPIVLVAHSYGGMVITNAVKDDTNVEALVYVDGFAPDAGETANGLVVRSPGSELGTAVSVVPLPGGVVDVYIQQDRVPTVFAADVPAADAQVMAVTQRPLLSAAGDEASGEPAWKTIPSWFIYGDKDLVIPAAAHAFMAERAGSRETVVIPGASHVPMISHPDEVANFILKVATTATAEAATAG
jgi:pimeloyl-ACP methyl ester carboxylesterase